MKYVFMLTLLIIAGAGALMGGVVAFRWVNNMTADRAHHAGRAELPDAERRAAPRGGGDHPQGSA